MFAAIHAMRARVITAPSFARGKVIGAILFEKTMDGMVDGKPTAEALKDRGVVPLIKVDQGLEDEAHGVQLMKPMTRLDALIEKSLAAGMFGTKMRSVINSADAEERSEEHTSELQSLMRNSYAVFCLQKKKTHKLSTYSIKQQ